MAGGEGQGAGEQGRQGENIFVTNYQLPITNYQLPITNYQLPITNYQLPITNYLSLCLPERWRGFLSSSLRKRILTSLKKSLRT
jgi:hypothetical protein